MNAVVSVVKTEVVRESKKGDAPHVVYTLSFATPSGGKPTTKRVR